MKQKEQVGKGRKDLFKSLIKQSLVKKEVKNDTLLVVGLVTG